MRRLIHHFWDEVQMYATQQGTTVCLLRLAKALPKALPLPTKLLNLLVDTITQEWIVQLLLEGAKDHGEQ
jgi:hypothetical protein